MVKREINVFEYAGDILAELKKGVLVTTKAGDKVNSMTISWGTLGVDWAMPVFTTFVREGRFTHEMLMRNPEFTVNIPFGRCNREILGYCGTRSGRDHDKIAELGLTTVEPSAVSVPAIKELPLTLECRVVYRQMQDVAAMPQNVRDKFYPQDVNSASPGSNRDMHEAFYGEIVAAYIIEDETGNARQD